MKIKEYGLRNKKQDYYLQRKQVMKHIYEAKQIARECGINHPRIEIRITEKSKECLGLATINSKNKNIWITEEAINRHDLRSIVFHEILHTLYNQDHVKNCQLMHEATLPDKYSNPTTQNKLITALFIKYITKNK
mgnify:CR=1 FL=1